MFTEPTPSASKIVADQPPTKKFMFERTFDPNAAARPVERKPVTLKPEQYDALKQESYDRGFAEGHKAGADELARQLIEATNRVVERIDQMMNNFDAFRKTQNTEMRQIAVAVVRKILPNFSAKNGLEEIQDMLNVTISEMVHEPRLVVRVHNSQFDTINSRITEITQQKAYAGKVVLLVDEQVACGDCRIEWADGGIERNTAVTLGEITDAIVPESTSPTLSPKE